MADFANAADALTRYLEARPNSPQRATLELRINNWRERAQRASAVAEPAPSTDPEATETAPETPPAPVVRGIEEEAGGGIGTPATIAFITAGVGVVAFGTFGILALSEDSSLSDDCGENAGRTCTEDEVSTLETYTLLADIGLGVAVVGAATGLALWLTGTGVDTERSAVSITPWIGPKVAGAAGEVRF